MRRSDDDGRTLYFPNCDVCLALHGWPRKNLIQGSCPKCGRDHPEAWRFAAALRLADKVVGE